MKKFINSVLILMISCGLIFTPGLVIGASGSDDSFQGGDGGDNPVGPNVADTGDGNTHSALQLQVMGNVDKMHNIHVKDIHNAAVVSFGHQTYDHSSSYTPMEIRIDHNTSDGFYFTIWAEKGQVINNNAINQFGTGTSHPLDPYPYAKDDSGNGQTADTSGTKFACFIHDDEYTNWTAADQVFNTGTYTFFRIWLEEFEDAYSDDATSALSGMHSQGRLFKNPNTVHPDEDWLSRLTLADHTAYTTAGVHSVGNSGLHDAQSTAAAAQNNARMITQSDAMITIGTADQWDFFYEYTPSQNDSEEATEGYMSMAHYGWTVHLYVPEAYQLHEGDFKTVLNVAIIDK